MAAELPVNVVLFDLDDTLYAERDYVFSGFEAVARWAEPRLGLPAKESSAELRRLFDCGVRGNTFNRWLESHQILETALVAKLAPADKKAADAEQKRTQAEKATAGEPTTAYTPRSLPIYPHLPNGCC